MSASCAAVSSLRWGEVLSGEIFGYICVYICWYICIPLSIPKTEFPPWSRWRHRVTYVHTPGITVRTRPETPLLACSAQVPVIMSVIRPVSSYRPKELIAFRTRTTVFDDRCWVPCLSFPPVMSISHRYSRSSHETHSEHVLVYMSSDFSMSHKSNLPTDASAAESLRLFSRWDFSDW